MYYFFTNERVPPHHWRSLKCIFSPLTRDWQLIFKDHINVPPLNQWEPFTWIVILHMRKCVNYLNHWEEFTWITTCQMEDCVILSTNENTSFGSCHSSIKMKIKGSRWRNIFPLKDPLKDLTILWSLFKEGSGDQREISSTYNQSKSQNYTFIYQKSPKFPRDLHHASSFSLPLFLSYILYRFLYFYQALRKRTWISTIF